MNKSLQQFQRWGEALDYTSHFCADTFLSALFSISDFSCWIKLYLFRAHSHTSEDIPVQNKCINQVIWYNKLAISYIEIISEVGKGQPNLKRNKTLVKILYMEKKREFLISFTSQMAHYIQPCYFLMKWGKDLTSPRLIHWKGCSKTENTILCCSFNLGCWAFFKRINCFKMSELFTFDSDSNMKTTHQDEGQFLYLTPHCNTKKDN